MSGSCYLGRSHNYGLIQLKDTCVYISNIYPLYPCFIIFKLEIQVQCKCGSFINTLYINLTAGLSSDSPVVARFPSDLFCTCSIFMLSQHIEATE